MPPPGLNTEIRPVLQIADTKAPGGIETAVTHYAAMFAELGIRSACLYRGPAADLLREAGVKVLNSPLGLTMPKFGLLPKNGVRGRVRATIGADPALLVVHSDRTLSNAKALWPEAIIVTPCHSDKTRRKRAANLVLTLNPHQHDLVRNELSGYAAKIAMLGNPFMHSPEVQAITNSPGRIVFCARLIPTKDPETLLRAIALLESPPAVVIMGSGPLEAELKTTAEGLRAEITFTGWLSNPWASIGRNDILVLPSLWEGLPYLLQEALDRHIAIIAADNPGNRQALGDGAFGVLFPPGDSIALASCIRDALDNPHERVAATKAGREQLVERYGAAGFWSRINTALEAPKGTDLTNV